MGWAVHVIGAWSLLLGLGAAPGAAGVDLERRTARNKLAASWGAEPVFDGAIATDIPWMLMMSRGRNGKVKQGGVVIHNPKIYVSWGRPAFLHRDTL